MKYRMHNKPVLNQLINGFLNDDFLNKMTRPAAHRPAVNIKETDNAFELEILAAGREKEDFKIEIDENVLTISANVQTPKTTEKTSEATETAEKKSATPKAQYSRREFVLSNFSRSFNLPETIDDQAIAAQYENGILFIQLPKKAITPKPAARKIEVLG